MVIQWSHHRIREPDDRRSEKALAPDGSLATFLEPGATRYQSQATGPQTGSCGSY